MKDTYGREINYLRISVTNACNLKCRYCVPPKGSRPCDLGRRLTNREIEEVVHEAVGLGFRKFRLTGGEPLMRPDIVDLTARIACIDGVDDLGMTSNGHFLAECAEPLADAGLHRVNVSLDAMDPSHYREITRGGDVEKVFEGIKAAMVAGLTPLKLNCVVEQSSEEPDARAVAAYAEEQGLGIRFIRRMDLEKGQYWVVQGGRGGDCPRCNRLRLTCDGRIKPCLFSDLSFNINELGVAKALRLAIEAKPESGHTCKQHDFCAVGG